MNIVDACYNDLISPDILLYIYIIQGIQLIFDIDFHINEEWCMNKHTYKVASTRTKILCGDRILLSELYYTKIWLGVLTYFP